MYGDKSTRGNKNCGCAQNARGTLYVVATPIGNMGDITLRALDTLKEVSVIAAEDTRVTGKLLHKYDIHTPMLSYHKNNFVSRGGELLSRLCAGESAAIVSDAGMPCISDPGEHIVGLCRDNGVPVAVVPGACAAVSALAVSGLPTARFVFVGFVSVNKRKRRECLQNLSEIAETLIFYEAPHKLKRTLADLYDVMGDREAALCRELTKIHEEVVRGRLSELCGHYGGDENPKGEFVVIVSGKDGASCDNAYGAECCDGNVPPDTVICDDMTETALDKAAELVRELVAAGVKRNAASKRAASLYGVRRSDIYNS